MAKNQALLTTSDINANINPLIEDDAGASLYAPSWLLGESNATEHFSAHSFPSNSGFDQFSFAPKSAGGGGGSGGSAAPPPNLLEAIAGPTFDTVAQKSGFYMIPPDCTEATGKSALVAATNGEIEVFARDLNTGVANTTPVINESLNQLFFGANGGDTAFDPKVVYDAAHDKFIVVALTENSTNHTSQILVAVSTDGTATHWNTHAFDSSLPTGGGSWADFPGVSVDGQGHIFITTNMFSFSGGVYEGSTLWTTDETLSSMQHVDPSVLAGVSSATGTNDLATLMPALMQGLNSDGTQPNGTYLVSYDGAKAANGDNILHVLQVDSTGNVTDHVIDVGVIDSAAAFSSFSAPQSQTTKTIDAGDDRVLDVVWQNGKLYAVTTIIPTTGPDAGHTTAHWFEIDTTNFTLVDQGNVSGSAIGAGDRTFYPDIAVDAAGDFAISFSVSGPNIHPGAYYAVHAAGDPLGVLEPAQLLAAGTDYYVRTFGSGDNRWGDFSSMSADPLHPGEFWAFNEYAMTRGDKFLGFGETGRWATEIGAFMVPQTTALNSGTSTTSTSSTDLSGPTLGQIVDTHLPLPHDNIV